MRTIARIHEKLHPSKDDSAVHFAEYTRSLAAQRVPRARRAVVGRRAASGES